MEIDFMFLWKSKVSDKRDLFSKVKDMLVQVFPDTQKDYISFIINNEIFKIPYKCSKGSDDSVYLKIECNQSDAKSAKILSAIREKICNGKHRKDFSIISTFDEASLSYCCRLMKPFGVFERRLRELMYLITVKAFGADWVEQSFPKDMINKIKEKTKGYITDDKITELAFELLDYGEIIDYLFSERRFGYTTEQIIDEELSDERLKSLSKEDIVQIVSKARKDTLWNKFFFNNKQLNFIEKERINSLRNYRNDIMHHHTINESKFQVIKKEINAVNKKLILAITDIDGKIYTNEEYGTVFSLIGNLTVGILDGIKKLFDEKFFDTMKTIGTVISNISEKMKIISPDISKVFKPDISQALKSATALPDLSGVLQDLKRATTPPDLSVFLQTVKPVTEPVKFFNMSQSLRNDTEPNINSDTLSDMESRKEINNSDSSNE